jgi:hypothetical protein
MKIAISGKGNIALSFISKICVSRFLVLNLWCGFVKFQFTGTMIACGIVHVMYEVVLLHNFIFAEVVCKKMY